MVTNGYYNNIESCIRCHHEKIEKIPHLVLPFYHINNLCNNNFSKRTGSSNNKNGTVSKNEETIHNVGASANQRQYILSFINRF